MGRIVYNCWVWLDPSFRILLLFFTLLAVAVVVNTALVSIPRVKEYILLNYGRVFSRS